MRLRRPGAKLILCGMDANSGWIQTEGRALAPVLHAAPGLTRDEVITASEVADLLHMPVSRVYEVARSGPGVPTGPKSAVPAPRLEELPAHNNAGEER
jgi:hypothetical protein